MAVRNAGTAHQYRTGHRSDSVTNDFFYYHLPHLGATAWAAIAATGVNPFTGSQEAD